MKRLVGQLVLVASFLGLVACSGGGCSCERLLSCDTYRDAGPAHTTTMELVFPSDAGFEDAGDAGAGDARPY